MKKVMYDLLQQGLTEWSNCPWTSAVILMRKKDGSFRCHVNFCALNDIIVKDSDPLPWINDSFDTLVDVWWFSTLDTKIKWQSRT